MRLAPTVVVLVRDADGFGAAISDALCPNADSNLKRESSSFQFSLEKYGIKDGKASGDLIQFVDADGSPQVSVFLLQNYGPPVASCAINELLASVSSEDSSTHTIVIPIFLKSLKFDREAKNEAPPLNHGFMLYGAEIAGRTELTQAIVGGTASLHPSLRIHSELAACLLMMVQVLHIPTAVLVASGNQLQIGSTQSDLEALNVVGQHLARHLGLHFAKDVQLKQVEKPIGVQEPWRELYG